MKALKNVFKGILSGAIAAFIAVLTINIVLASNNPLKPLSIPTRPTQPLTIDSSPNDVLGLMLDSDKMWNSLVAEYKLTKRDSHTDKVEIETQRFWLAEKGKMARVEVDGANSIIFVRGATAIKEEKRNKKIYFDSNIPKAFLYGDFNPRKWLADNPSGVYLHPFGKALPTGYYDFLYPTAIAQGLITNQASGLENITVIGEEDIAGRKTIIISRMPKNHLYWVDAETGVILRAQYIGESGQWQMQFDSQSIIYGVKIPETVFEYVPAKGMQQVTPSQFQDQP